MKEICRKECLIWRSSKIASRNLPKPSNCAMLIRLWIILKVIFKIKCFIILIFMMIISALKKMNLRL